MLPGTLSPPGIVRALVMAAAVVVTLVTGVDYVLQAMRGSIVQTGGRADRKDGQGRHEGGLGVGVTGGSAGEAARDLASQVLDRLRADGVAVAESLTGGSSRPRSPTCRSSAAFRGGVVAYATELKATLLGVDELISIGTA